MSFLFGNSVPASTSDPKPQVEVVKRDVGTFVQTESKPVVHFVNLAVENDEKIGFVVKPDLNLMKTTTVVLGSARSKAKTSGKTSSKRGGKGGKKKKGNLRFRDAIVFNNVGRPPLIRVPTNNQVFRVVQSYETLSYASSSASVQTFTATAPTINSLDQISSLTGVFDQYKIERIEVWLTPRLADNAKVINGGLFHSVIDFDDVNSLSNVAAALDYANCVVSSGICGHYRTWVPHVAVAAYSGAFTSYENQEAPWIDAASPSVYHFGLKTAWTVTDAVYVYDASWRLHTAWRNVR